MIRYVLVLILLTACTTTAKGKRRECQPECRVSNSDAVILQER